MIGFLHRKKPMVWSGLITIRKINDFSSMRPKMIALNPWMSCAFPSSFSFTFLFHCKRMFVSTSTYILTFLTKALNWTFFFFFKFTFVEVSIALVFYFQIWDLWESKYYLKFDISPLSSSILFHCAYICSPTTIASLNPLIKFNFCLFYSHTLYKSSSIDLNLVNTNGVPTFLSNFESVTKKFYKLKVTFKPKVVVASYKSKHQV
jgi:hypothetical protein